VNICSIIIYKRWLYTRTCPSSRYTRISLSRFVSLSLSLSLSLSISAAVSVHVDAHIECRYFDGATISCMCFRVKSFGKIKHTLMAKVFSRRIHSYFSYAYYNISKTFSRRALSLSQMPRALRQLQNTVIKTTKSDASRMYCTITSQYNLGYIAFSRKKYIKNKNLNALFLLKILFFKSSMNNIKCIYKPRT